MALSIIGCAHLRTIFITIISAILLQAFSANVQAETKALRYCIDPSWEPYEYLVDGKHAGISAYYLKQIAKHANLELTLISTPSWKASLEALETGDCDLTPLLNYSEQRAKSISFSDPYFYAPNVIFAHQSHQLIGSLSSVDNERIAVVKGYRLESYLSTHYPNFKLVTVNSELEALSMVNNQEVELFISSFYGANFLIHAQDLTNLRIVGVAEVKDQLRIGLTHQFSDLIPDINQAIASLTDDQHRTAFQLLEPVKLISQQNYTLAWQVSCLFLAVIMGLSIRHYYTLKQRKILATKNSDLQQLKLILENKNQQLEEMAVKDPLTKLYNRHYFTEKTIECINNFHRYHTNCCMILFDIDDFKKFNDDFGHQTGDQVLIELGSQLQKSARNTDFIARWGGEEFVIICPETTIDEAMYLAKRFQQNLHNASQQLPSTVSCSIGIAQLTTDDNEQTWFSHTDNALYQAKSEGKNTIRVYQPAN
ncbi:transporter substrate-binding domain-containing diguanylate cyclase [Colwellia sp. MEBiC06753]